MLYPFMTLDDNTEIVHSEMRDDGSVQVCCERPVFQDLKTAYCDIPGYRWYDDENFTEDELSELTKVLKTVSHLILKYARNGGFLNASGF